MKRRLLNLLTARRPLAGLPRLLANRRRLVGITVCLAVCLLVGSCSANRLILGTEPGGTAAPLHAATGAAHVMSAPWVPG